MAARARRVATATLLAILLASSGCSSASDRGRASAADAGGEGATPAPGRSCLVADTGGLGDQSFNQTAFQGELDAEATYGWAAYAVESHSTDYGLYLDEYMSSERCDLIISVGALMTDATALAADQALFAPVGPVPQRFVLLDSPLDPTRSNVRAQTYRADQAAFLAGYAAAATSATGVVATFGGVPIDPVTQTMDGFVLGVRAYDAAHSNEPPVQVLGWDPDKQTGTFLGSFVDQDAGRKTASAQVDAGADVILPVAGGAGLGAGEALLQAGKGYLIGVDSDWTKSAPQYKSIVLTSVLKRLDLSVLAAVKAVVDGTFDGGPVESDLASGEIDLAPFLPGVVPEDAQKDLPALRAGIIAGTIETKH